MTNSCTKLPFLFPDPCVASSVIICHEKVEVTYWNEEKFNQRIFTDEGNDEIMQAAMAAHAAGM